MDISSFFFLNCIWTKRWNPHLLVYYFLKAYSGWAGPGQAEAGNKVSQEGGGGSSTLSSLLLRWCAIAGNWNCKVNSDLKLDTLTRDAAALAGFFVFVFYFSFLFFF